MHRALCAAEKHSCQCRGGLPSSLLCQNNDSFQWPVASEFFLMCVDMNKVGFQTVATVSSWLQRSRIVRNACGSRSHYTGTYPKICRVIVNVFIVRVFPGLVIQSSVFSVWACNPSGFCYSQSTRPSRAVNLLFMAMFLSGVSEIVHPLESCAKSTCPSTKRLPVVLYQHDAASLETAVLTAPPIDETIFYLREGYQAFRSPTWDLCSGSIYVPGVDKSCSLSTDGECLGFWSTSFCLATTSFRPKLA